MTPEEIKQLRDELGLTQAEFAGRLGVAMMTVSRWETGASRPRGLSLQALHRLRARTDARRKRGAAA